jgi:hypothetical protein
LGNDLPNGLVHHSGNMHDFLLELVLLDCSGWLLGQEDGLPGCSDAGIDFLLAGCSDGTATAEETALVLLLLVLTMMLVLVLVTLL